MSPAHSSAARRRRHPFGVWRSAPLSARLPLIICVVLFVGIAVFGAGASVALGSYLMRSVDAEVATNAKAMAANPERTFAQGTGDWDMPTDYVAQYTSTQTGQGLLRKPGSLPPARLPDFSTKAPNVLAGDGEPFTVRSKDGRHAWRAVSAPIAGDDATMTVALPLDSVTSTLTKIRMVLVLAAVGVVLVGTLLGYWLVRRSLRPLRAIEQTAAEIAAGDLSRRIAPQPPSTEVGQLSISLNRMLAHIEAAFEAQRASEARMRQFVSDASHELRTPLASIRGYGELYRMGALTKQEDVAGAMGRIESEATRMGSLVQDLLQLARLDEGRPLARTRVDLTALALDAASDLHAAWPDRPVAVVPLASPPDAKTFPGDPGIDGAASAPDHREAVAPCWAIGDPDRLRQVLANLTSNACQHTPTGTAIEIATGLAGPEGPAVIEVRDHGPGIDDADAARVFERFYRTDSSRTRASGGSGLGLAIVASIAAAQGGSVRYSQTPGGGATFAVTVPAAEM